MCVLVSAAHAASAPCVCCMQVFVAAHTSAGKTVVAEYAFALAGAHASRWEREGRRVKGWFVGGTTN